MTSHATEIEPRWRVRAGRECRSCGEVRLDRMQAHKSSAGGYGRTCKACIAAAKRRGSPQRPGARRFGVQLSARLRADDLTGALDVIRRHARTNATGCWLWPGGMTHAGYGHHTAGSGDRRVRQLAHRLVVFLLTGEPVATSVVVHHRCATRACVRPDHLQVTEQADNTAEMFARRAYETEIAALRAALAEVAPGHPLL